MSKPKTHSTRVHYYLPNFQGVVLRKLKEDKGLKITTVMVEAINEWITRRIGIDMTKAERIYLIKGEARLNEYLDKIINSEEEDE